MWLSPLLTGISVVAVVLVTLLVRVNVRRSRVLGIRFSELARRSYTAFGERISALRLIKMRGQEDREVANARDIAEGLKAVSVRITLSQSWIEVVVDPSLMMSAFIVLFVGIQYLGLSLAGLSVFLFVLLRLNQKAKEFSTGRQTLSSSLESLLFVERTTQEAATARRITSGPLRSRDLTAPSSSAAWGSPIIPTAASLQRC